MRKIFQSSSSRETEKIGYDFAMQIVNKKPGDCALVIGLRGELGAGKTTFVQGFLKGLGIKKRSPSPTFIIFRRHVLPQKKVLTNSSATNFSDIYHMDAYRLKDEAALTALDFKKILADPTNILLVEWGEKIKKALPRKTLWLKFNHGKKEGERKIEVLSLSA
jgi:tRNA threonylcarbamoyladenosine biosynthesis protein TsaE